MNLIKKRKKNSFSRLELGSRVLFWNKIQYTSIVLNKFMVRHDKFSFVSGDHIEHVKDGKIVKSV